MKLFNISLLNFAEPSLFDFSIGLPDRSWRAMPWWYSLEALLMVPYDEDAPLELRAEEEPEE